mmetsp:Transcript_97363/g.275200  ORF Transcript_97363/g.275200 Transcript_97363/m.275200 type:complete len:671 (+) Transcript_97363:149-2161(+)
MASPTPGMNAGGKMKALTMDMPLANPLFLSDSPRFLHRQCARAACAVVSEHMGSFTCPCQKCTEAAQARCLALPAEAAGLSPKTVAAVAAFAGAGAARSSTTPPEREVRRRSGLPLRSAANATDEAAATLSTSCAMRCAPKVTSSRREHRLHDGSASPQSGGCPSVGDASARGGGCVGDRADGEPKDLVWLLKVISTVCDSLVGDDEEEFNGNLDSNRRLSLGASAFGHDEKHTMQARLGFKIPDTVVLEKGKPKKRYAMDSGGHLIVMEPKTSADLLRVLREFVRRARTRQLLDKAASDVLQAPDVYGAGARQSHNSLVGACDTVDIPALARARGARGSKSDSALVRRANTLGNAKSRTAESAVRRSRAVHGAGLSSALREVAVLYYNDVHRTVRLMTGTEAEAQMLERNGYPASKLPREFWQDVRVLQTPVRSSMRGGVAQYITYSFDARSCETEPQAPIPWAHRRTESVPHVDHRGGKKDARAALQASRVAIVLKKLNEFLRMRHGLELVSGQFEFVFDEVDATLWLVNASRLICKKSERRKEVQVAKVEEERLFDEEEFSDNLKKTEARLADLKWRFGRSIGSRDQSEATSPAVLHAADRVAGNRVPEDFTKYYEAKARMNRFFQDEVKSNLEVHWKNENGIVAGPRTADATDQAALHQFRFVNVT